jgi:hypothetical protein
VPHLWDLKEDNVADIRPNEILGYSITGDYTRYSELQTEQYPLEQLLPYLQKVIDDPEVTEFGWTQYTPYFNDGDACVFHAFGTWISTEPVTDSDDEEDEDGYYKMDKYAVKSYSYRGSELSPQHYIDLEKAIEAGHFYNVLLETFGDPAEVTWSRETADFHIEYAEHE